jgi:hypothetical protein
VLLSHVQLYGFQARLRSFGEANKLNNGGQTLQANATLATSYPRRRSTPHHFRMPEALHSTEWQFASGISRRKEIVSPGPR